MKLASFVDLRTLSELPVVLTLTKSIFAAKNTQKLSSVRFCPNKMQHGLRMRWESQGTNNQTFVKFLHLVSVPIYLFRSSTFRFHVKDIWERRQTGTLLPPPIRHFQAGQTKQCCAVWKGGGGEEGGQRESSLERFREICPRRRTKALI